MGWRFVRQPNGLLARFSDVVDNFTHCNLSTREAIEVCCSEHGMSEAAAATKVRGGTEDWKPFTSQEKGSGLDRWNEALASIKMIHGESGVTDILNEINSQDKDIKSYVIRHGDIASVIYVNNVAFVYGSESSEPGHKKAGDASWVALPEKVQSEVKTRFKSVFELPYEQREAFIYAQAPVTLEA